MREETPDQATFVFNRHSTIEAIIFKFNLQVHLAVSYVSLPIYYKVSCQ